MTFSGRDLTGEMEDDKSAPLASELYEELKEMVSKGMHVGAILRLREATGCGLREAKDRFEHILEAGGLAHKWVGRPCPFCGEALRTDLAQQCFECGKDWHGVPNG